MKFGVIVAARSGSARLPRKGLRPLQGVPMIVFLFRRILPSKLADKIIFATTDLTEDDELASTVGSEGVPVFRGANDDVVKRYVDAATSFNMSYVVRVTGDCPFVDAQTLDYCLDQCRKLGPFDLASTKGLFPVGIDYEIYNAEAMRKLHESGLLTPGDREHPTKYIYDHAGDFNIEKLMPPPGWACTWPIHCRRTFKKG